MAQIMKILEGQKTNLGMIALGILGICYTQNWIDESTAKVIGLALTTWTGVGISSKANRAIKTNGTK